MRRPSFQFYPGDWQANSNLRRCTHAEKGVWGDVMCLLHDQEIYGVLRWSLKEIAQAVGCSVSVLKALGCSSLSHPGLLHSLRRFKTTPTPL